MMATPVADEFEAIAARMTEIAEGEPRLVGIVDSDIGTTMYATAEGAWFKFPDGTWLPMENL